MEQRLFIITNDTHFLNVGKYISSHQKGENYVLMLVNPFEGYSNLLKKVKEDKDLIFLEEMFSPKQLKFPFNYWEILRIMRKIISFTARTGGFDKVFFTNYNSWIQHYLLKQYPQSQKIYISDGTAIFPIAERRKKDKTVPFRGNKFFAEHVLKLKPVPNLHFFTPIKLDLPPSDTMELFTYNNSAEASVDESKIYFVGGPLVELQKLKDSANMEHLNNLRDSFSAQQIHYFAHRREKEENLNRYAFFDKVIKDDRSFEERLASEKALPSKVISYVSSVLVNLAPVYPQVEFLYLPIGPEDIPAGDEFHERYKALKNNFEKLELHNLKELVLKKHVNNGG